MNSENMKSVQNTILGSVILCVPLAQQSIGQENLQGFLFVCLFYGKQETFTN